jgi:hypothetical protein
MLGSILLCSSNWAGKLAEGDNELTLRENALALSRLDC